MLQRKRPYHQRHPALTQSIERRDLRRFKLKALTEEVRPFPDQYAYQVVCTELHSPELGRYVAYGLLCYQYLRGVWKPVSALCDLSLHSEEVLALAARFNAAQLSPLHFREAVEDWLADL